MCGRPRPEPGLIPELKREGPRVRIPFAPARSLQTSVPRTPLPEMTRRKSVAPRQGAEGQPVSRGVRWEALRAALDRNRAARCSLVFGNVEIWCRKPVTDLSRGG